MKLIGNLSGRLVTLTKGSLTRQTPKSTMEIVRPMQVTFLLSHGEFETARKAFSKRTHSRARRALPWLNIAVPLVMALVCLLEGFRFFLHPHRTPDIFSIALTPLWLAIAAFHWRRRNQFHFDPDYANEQVFELSADGIVRGPDGTARVRVPWTKISRYVETDEFFLLSSPWPWGNQKPEKPSMFRQDKPVLYILPKRAFDSGDVERFRDLLQRKLSVWAKNPSLKAETILTA
jgi:hypothetical protein